MEIFNKNIFGSDADEFMQLSSCDKLAWIKKHTNQQNDEIIKEFIKVATKGKECKCLDCGKYGNISKKYATEIADSVNDSEVTTNGKRGSSKRRKDT